MSRFDKDTLAQDTDGTWHGHTDNLSIARFSNDTRSLQSAEVFLAIKTDKRDGHDYLADAKSQGASCAIVERIVHEVDLPQLKVGDTLHAFQKTARAHRNRFPGKVVGVTGSCGKTTTKDWLACLLGSDNTHATRINLNNVLGVPLTLTGIDFDDHHYAVVEAGMNMLGEMDVIAPMITPDIAVITNVAPVHLEMVGTIEDVAKQKAMLGVYAAPSGIVLFPESCLQFEAFKNFRTHARILAKDKESVEGYPDNQVISYSIQESNDAVQLSLKLNNEVHEFQLPLLSDGMLSNAALSIATARLLGISPETIAERILQWQPAEHRGEVFQYNDQYYYVDCYNANPVAMKDALGIFHKLADSSKPNLYVLGCMGELGPRALEYHYEIGMCLKLRDSDNVLAIGKDAEAYRQGLIAAGNHEAQIFTFADKAEAQNIISNFSGNIFLKGSKVYELWKLLPQKAERIQKKVAAC